MRAYTHRGRAHRQQVNTTFWLGKNSQISSCASDGVWTSGIWTSSRYSTNWATPDDGDNDNDGGVGDNDDDDADETDDDDDEHDIFDDDDSALLISCSKRVI